MSKAFGDPEKIKIKQIVSEGVTVMQEIQTLQEGLNETIKAVAEELEVKPSVIKKAIKVAQKDLWDQVYREFDDLEAIGDISGVLGENGRPLPMVAPVAMQQGRFVAEQIKAISSGKEPKEFKYKDKGSMATIGRHKAVVEVGKIKFKGILAWYAWLWLHLFYL